MRQEYYYSLARPRLLPKSHAVLLITEINGEHAFPNAAMYTYIIFREPGKGSAQQEDAIRRYDALVSAIVTEPAASSLSGSSVSRTNMFCIPVRKESMASKSLQNPDNYKNIDEGDYSKSLGDQYLIEVRNRAKDEKVLTRLSNNSGPFLISTSDPIHDAAAGQPLLVVDLSIIEPDAIQAVVNQYKARIEAKALDEREMFSTLRFKLIEFVSQGDQVVTLTRLGA